MATERDVLGVFTTSEEDAAEDAGVIRTMTVRMPTELFRLVKSMAEAADMSRNAMAVQLVRWGVEHALGQLPDEIRDEIISSAAEGD